MLYCFLSPSYVKICVYGNIFVTVLDLCDDVGSGTRINGTGTNFQNVTLCVAISV